MNDAIPFETVIADLTRNLLNAWVSPPREGDGGCASAMTVKGWM